MQTSQCNSKDLAYRTRIPTVNEDEPILTARALADAVEKFTEEFFGGVASCGSVDLDARLFVNRESLAFLITAILTKASAIGFCKISYSMTSEGLNVDFTVAGSEKFDGEWATELFTYAEKYELSVSRIERGLRAFIPVSHDTYVPLHSHSYDNFSQILAAAYRIFCRMKND